MSDLEWVLAIPHEQAFKRMEEPWGGAKTSYLTGIKETLEAKYGPIHFTRLYFGEEFCERALSTGKALAKAVAAAEERGWGFTYVTPYLTETGLTKVQRLLDILAQTKPEAEVVINDWGVLDWVTEHHPTFTPVLGRLMNKIIRDPRMPDSLRNSPDQTVMHKFRTCNLAGGEMKDLLDQYQVKRVELDYPPQGLDPNLPAWGYDTSLSIPYGVIMTGRICLMQSWGLAAGEKFRTTGPCPQRCRLGWLELSDPSGRVKKNKDWQIIQKGNTVFYRQNKEFLAEILTEAEKTGVSRMIFQPEPI